MAEAGENFAAFNSRALVEMVGGVTDEALKATRIKKFLSVLAGRYFNWAGRKSLFTLHLGIKCCAIEMAAAATPRFDGDRFGVLFRSSPPSVRCAVDQRANHQEIRRQSCPIVGANARAKVLHRYGRMRHLRWAILPILQHPRRGSTRSFRSTSTSQVALHAQKHSSMGLGCCARKSSALAVHQAWTA